MFRRLNFLAILLWIQQSYPYLINRPYLSYKTTLQSSFPSNNENQVKRSEIPTRYDFCKVLVSGVVGTPPKEVFLANGHYAQNFAVSYFVYECNLRN